MFYYNSLPSNVTIQKIKLTFPTCNAMASFVSPDSWGNLDRKTLPLPSNPLSVAGILMMSTSSANSKWDSLHWGLSMSGSCRSCALGHWIATDSWRTCFAGD